jgi:hypothetical protein
MSKLKARVQILVVAIVSLSSSTGRLFYPLSCIIENRRLHRLFSNGEFMVIGKAMIAMSINVVRIGLVLAGLLLLPACGQSPAAIMAPCSLLSTQEVSTSLGATITTGNPQTDNPKYSLCNYYSPGQTPSAPSPMVIVQFNRQPMTAAALSQSLAKAKLSVEPITGIGDAAFYATESPEADGTLFIIKDAHLLSVAIIDSPQDHATTRHTEQVLGQLALSRYH